MSPSEPRSAGHPVIDRSTLDLPRRVGIAIPAETPVAWQSLLRHLGVPTVRLDSCDAFEADAILLVGIDLEQLPTLLERVHECWSKGIPIVADARCAARLSGREALRFRADRLVGSGFAFRGLGSVAVEGPIEALVRDGAPEAISLLAQRPAPLYALALPKAEHLDPNRTIRRRVATVSTGPVYSEVPSCDLWAISELLRNALTQAASQRGAPLLTASMIPDDSACAFSLIVEVGSATPHEVRECATRLEDAALRASFRFEDLDRASFLLLGELHRRGHECIDVDTHPEEWIGVDGYEDSVAQQGPVLRSRFLTELERRTADEAPRSFGPCPVLAPRVHPVTTGQLVEVASNDSEIVEHFTATLRDALLKAEPIVLRIDLDQPIVGGLFRALRAQVAAFETLRSEPVWVARYTELRQFWKDRARHVVEAFQDSSGIELSTEGSVGTTVHTPLETTRVRRGRQRVDMSRPKATASRDPGRSTLDIARPGELESKVSAAWSRVLRRGQGSKRSAAKSSTAGRPIPRPVASRQVGEQFKW